MATLVLGSFGPAVDELLMLCACEIVGMLVKTVLIKTVRRLE